MPAPDDAAAPSARKWRVLETSEGEFEVIADQQEYDSIATIWAGPNAARLIAAAPSLYEALAQLLHECVQAGFDSARDYNWPKSLADARAALALARGESNA